MDLTIIGQFLKQLMSAYLLQHWLLTLIYFLFSKTWEEYFAKQCWPKDDAAEISLGQSMILYVLTQSSKVQLFLWAVSSMKPSTTSPTKNLNARCDLWLQTASEAITKQDFSFVLIANTSWTLSPLHSQRCFSYGKCFCLMLIQKKTLWFSAPLHELSD